MPMTWATPLSAGPTALPGAVVLALADGPPALGCGSLGPAPHVMVTSPKGACLPGDGSLC